MDILQYLIALLKIRQEVGVAGLGTFIKTKTPGRYDTASHAFIPPSHKLTFSTDLLEDNNLCEFIQIKRQLTETSARYFIQQFAEELRKALINEKVELQNLGTLALIEGKIVFSEQKDSTASFDFFALPQIEATQQHAEIAPNTSVAESDIIEKTEPSSNITINEITSTQPNSEITPEEKFESPASEVILETTAVSPENETDVSPISEIQPEEEVVAENPSAVEDELSAPQELAKPTSLEIHQEPEIEIVENNKVSTKSNIAPDHSIIAEIKNEADAETSQEVFEEIANVYAGSKPEQETKAADQPEGIKVETNKFTWDFSDAETEEESPEETTEEEEIDEDEVIEKSIPWYQKISLLVLIIGAIAGLAYVFEPQAFDQFKSDNGQTEDKMPIPVTVPELKTEKDSLSFADSIMQGAEKVGLQIERAKDTLKVSSNTHAPTSVYTYDIIAAAFAKDSEVKEFIVMMKKKGFEAKVADMPGKLFKKISIASFNNLDSAEANLKQFKKQLKNDKIYIQKIKNN